jgi:phage tail-like protein
MTRRRGWLVRRLPVGMQEDRTMTGLVAILEEVSETVQQQADQIPFLADPSVVPEFLLSWLGRFVDAPGSENLPEAHRRDLLRETGSLILRKGTRDYIFTLIAPYLVGPIYLLEDGGVFREGESGRCEGNIVVRASAIAHGSASDLYKLVRSITPVHCQIRIEIAGRTVAPVAA